MELILKGLKELILYIILMIIRKIKECFIVHLIKVIKMELKLFKFNKKIKNICSLIINSIISKNVSLKLVKRLKN
jgi:hypothetical protein